MKTTLVPWRERLFRPVSRIEEEMEGLFEKMFGDGSETLPTGAFAPKTDLVETDKAFEVSVDLPGMKPEEVSVELRDGSLWISGEHKEEKEEKEKTYHRIERSHGEFRRIIPLGSNLDPEHVEAAFDSGVLKVTVPKTEVTPTKRIEVKG
ncbi:MAG: Hsp20/alpha crystallin family protein [Planctomycetales bacterium]|nr:Hsp20/alpha crystallin family protein [Planctomycetales bacterium]